MYLSDVDEGGETVLLPSAAWSGTADRTGGEDGGVVDGVCRRRHRPAAKTAEVVAARDRLDELKGDFDDAADARAPRRVPGREVDGTREFVGGRGGECSVCVGFACAAAPARCARASCTGRSRRRRMHAVTAGERARAECALLPAPAGARGEVADLRDREAGATRDVRAVREGSRRVTRYFCFRFSG